MTTELSDSTVAGAGVLSAFSNSLAEVVQQSAGAIVTVNARRRGAASGVCWRPGIIVTTDHAVHREEDITVTFGNDRTLTTSLIGRDSGTGLAVLQGEGDLSSIPPATLGEATQLQVGHLVLAIARSRDSGISASLGVISALSGSWRTWHGGRIDQFIRPSLALYPGFTGSALVNTAGQVVGINTATPRQMALTIPTATVNRVVDQLVQGGRVARGYLGLGMQSVQLPESLRRSLNLSQDSGVMVVSVEPEAPADRAGVLIGDILVKLGEVAVGDISDVHALLDPDRVGQPLPAQMIRGGQLREVTITVGERPGREG